MRPMPKRLVLVLHENGMLRGAVAGALEMAGHDVEFSPSSAADLCIASAHSRALAGIPVVRLEASSGIGEAMRQAGLLLRLARRGAA